MTFYINSFSVLSKTAKPIPKWKIWILKLIKVKPLPLASYTLLAKINDSGIVQINDWIKGKDDTFWVVMARDYDAITIQSLILLSETPNICDEAQIMCSAQTEL